MYNYHGVIYPRFYYIDCGRHANSSPHLAAKVGAITVHGHMGSLRMKLTMDKYFIFTW